MQFKKTTIALSLLTAFTLAGCGSDSGSTSSSTTTSDDEYTITAIDGYLEDAEIYVDCNDDGIADSSDALGTTDSDGKLAISTDYQGCSIIVKAVAGQTKDTGTTIETPYEMIAESGSEVVTPFTTLAAVYGVTLDELAADLGYDSEVISGDFIAKAADSNDDNVEDAQKAALLASTMTSVFESTVRSNNTSELLAATQATQSIITTLTEEDISLADVTINISTEVTDSNDSSSVTASVSVTNDGESTPTEITSDATIAVDDEGGVTGNVTTAIGENEYSSSDINSGLSINTDDAFTDSLASYVNNKTWYGSYLYGFNKDYVQTIAFDSETGSYTKNGDAAGDYSVSDNAVTFNGDESSFFYYSEKLLVSVGETNTIFWSSENIAAEIEAGTFEPETITEDYIAGKTFYALWNSAEDDTVTSKWVLNTNGTYTADSLSDDSFSDTGTWTITSTDSGLLDNDLSLLNFKSDSDEDHDFSVIALIANDDVLVTLEYSVPDEEGDVNRFNTTVDLYFTDKNKVDSIYEEWLKTQDSTDSTDSLASYVDDKTWYITSNTSFDIDNVDTVKFDDGTYTQTSGEESLEGSYTIGDTSITFEEGFESSNSSELSFYYASSDVLLSIDNEGLLVWLSEDYSNTDKVSELSKSTFNNNTWYLLSANDAITLNFPSDDTCTASGEDNGEAWFIDEQDCAWEIDGNKLTFTISGEDPETLNYTLINDNDEDALIFVDSDNEEELNLFIKDKATADSIAEKLEEQDAPITYDIIEGKVTFTDESSIPDDAMVRIVPNSYSEKGDYSMSLICDIDEDGSFGSDCIIESNQKEDFDRVLADPDEIYQVVVFKDHIQSDRVRWSCQEDVYKYAGYSVSNWSIISISSGDYEDRSDETCHY